MLLLIVLGAATISSGGEFPALMASEDDLYEALQRGEITYDQYLIWQELLVNGVDSTNTFILDDVPSLDWNAPDNGMDSAVSEVDTSGSSSAIPLHGVLSYRYYRDLDPDSRSKYQNSLNATIDDNWRLRVKIRRETSGRERVVDRGLDYRSRGGLWREITLGNFSKRLGLGTVMGYRGKLFDYSPRLDTESWFFPDNGGFNGLFTRLVGGDWELQSIGSVGRDSGQCLTAAGVIVAHNGLNFTPAVIVGWNRSTNRSTGQTANITSVALYTQYVHQRGKHVVELCRQGGDGSAPFDAVVLEGRYRSRFVSFQYAGWVYADSYLDLTAGSRTGSIGRTEIIEATEFDYSNKRAGQEGVLLRTNLQRAGRFQPAASLRYASLNADTSDFQWLSEIAVSLSSQLTISAEHLTKVKTRRTDDDNVRTTKRQTRIHLRYRTASMLVRSHIGYNSQSQQHDNLAWLVYLKYHSASSGLIEISSNLAEIDLKSLRGGYWYFYVRSGFEPVERLGASVKFSHSYNHAATETNRHQITLEVTYRI